MRTLKYLQVISKGIYRIVTNDYSYRKWLYTLIVVISHAEIYHYICWYSPKFWYLTDCFYPSLILALSLFGRDGELSSIGAWRKRVNFRCMYSFPAWEDASLNAPHRDPGANDGAVIFCWLFFSFSQKARRSESLVFWMLSAENWLELKGERVQADEIFNNYLKHWLK